MPTPPPDRSRRSLSHGQEMFLLYGPADRWDDAFADEAEVCEAWNYHRARILSHYRSGRRPWAWWAYEARVPHPGNHQASTLYEMGVLSDEERAELEHWWREQYLRAWGAHFFHCEGPGRIFEGPIARRKHYAWADIPRDLLKRWTRERRRRRRIIHALKAVGAVEPAEPPPAA
jgi:hypothetical protein